jgi:hypothetical protein
MAPRHARVRAKRHKKSNTVSMIGYIVDIVSVLEELLGNT